MINCFTINVGMVPGRIDVVLNGIWNLSMVSEFTRNLESAIDTVADRYAVRQTTILYDSRSFPVQQAVVAAALEEAAQRPRIRFCRAAIVKSKVLLGLQAKRVVPSFGQFNTLEEAAAWLSGEPAEATLLGTA